MEPVEPVLARLAAARPRIAEEIDRPHAEEALLAGVVLDLLHASALPALAVAVGAEGTYERCLLWGADPESGAEDLMLANALREVVPGAGRASVLEAEPDLVVVTSSSVVAVDASVGRPGHAAARTRRGEPVPAPLLKGVWGVLDRHGLTLRPEQVAVAYAPARLAAVTLVLASALDRTAMTVALAGRAVDLLRPDRDDVTTWSDAAAVLLRAAGDAPLDIRALSWLQVADRLTSEPGTSAAVARIRTHPTLAARRE